MGMEQESFRLIGESAVVRAGVRSQRGEAGIEVLVRLAPNGTAFSSIDVRKMLDRLDVLLDHGYSLTAQEGWWIVCDRTVDEDELASAEHFVLSLFGDLLDRQ